MRRGPIARIKSGKQRWNIDSIELLNSYMVKRFSVLNVVSQAGTGKSRE
jgi:hypothetical protein